MPGFFCSLLRLFSRTVNAVGNDRIPCAAWQRPNGHPLAYGPSPFYLFASGGDFGASILAATDSVLMTEGLQTFLPHTDPVPLTGYPEVQLRDQWQLFQSGCSGLLWQMFKAASS